MYTSGRMVEHFVPFREQLLRLPYIKEASITSSNNKHLDGTLELRAHSRKFEFPIEIKRSFLTTSITNGLISRVKNEKPLMLFARYISRQTGERLAEAGINFVDEAGNMNVALGNDFHTLVLGKPQKHAEPESKRLGAATVQVLFTCLAKTDAMALPVRELAALAGVGKTAAAEARQKLLDEGILQEVADKPRRIGDAKRLSELFLDGYHRILRPHLFIGRYRSQDRDPDLFVKRFADFAQEHTLDWALTGGAGAAALDQFYRGEETSIFVCKTSRDVSRLLSLLPDRRGPITLLRLFSPLVVLPRSKGQPVAHPWLLYAELLQHNEPRALEAAEEIRERYLQS
jgi:hypothetical protein